MRYFPQMKRVVYLPAAAKALRKYRNIAAHIMEKVDAYAADPAPLANNVKALKGSRAVRLRIGDIRVIFEETDEEIIVTRIGPRRSIYD
jgi:mRNA interferase RelE/StbE